VVVMLLTLKSMLQVGADLFSAAFRGEKERRLRSRCAFEI
jgi:hypothetical protein